MRQSTLLPILTLGLLSSVNAAYDCFNSYQGHSCNGSIIGVANNTYTQDVSHIICCQGSTTCDNLVDGSVTTCTSGTALTLANLTAIPTTSSSSSAAPTPTAGSGSGSSASASAKPNAAVRMGDFNAAAWAMSVLGLGVGVAAMV